MTNKTIYITTLLTAIKGVITIIKKKYLIFYHIRDKIRRRTIASTSRSKAISVLEESINAKSEDVWFEVDKVYETRWDCPTCSV